MSEGTRRPNAHELENQVRAAIASGRISPTDALALQRADALRPVDSDMLSTYFEALSRRVQLYGRLLRIAFEIARDSCELHEKLVREQEIDDILVILSEPLPLWKEQILAIYDYLVQLRVTNNWPSLRIKNQYAGSAHALTSLFLGITKEGWKKCRELSDRSTSEPSLQGPTCASELFVDNIMDRLPSVNEIEAENDRERVLAMQSIRTTTAARSVFPDDQSAFGLPIRTDSVSVVGNSVSVYGGNPETESVDAKNASPPADPKPRPNARRGRRVAFNSKDDARVATAWETGTYETYAELEREFGLSEGDAERAIDRHRKRQKRH